MIVIRLFEPQAKALLKAATAVLKGRPVTNLEAAERACLERAVETIQNALSDSKPNPLDKDISRFADTLYALKLGVVRDWAMRRVQHLHRLVILWKAGSELPLEIQGKVLQLSAMSAPGWRLEVEKLLAEHGLRFDLPSDADYHVLNLPRRHEDEEGGGE